MNGKRHSAARSAGRRLANQNRQTRAKKRAPSAREAFGDFKAAAQKETTRRAKAAAAAQRRPSNTEPLPSDNIPVTNIGLTESKTAEQTLDWTGGSTMGNGGGGGGGNGGGDMPIAQGNWFTNLTPVHKAIIYGVSGFALWRYFNKRKK